LRDFGSLQFLWDSFSGEYIKVHGSEAVTEDGPWQLVLSENSAKLVSIDSENGDSVRLDPEQVASLVAHVNADGKLVVGDKGEVDKLKFVPLHSWLGANKSSVVSKALVLHVHGYAPFKCVFSWEEVPFYCGDKPVSLWVDFAWLLGFVFGKKCVNLAWRYAGYLSGYLQKLGLDESHVSESARSRASKLRRTSETPSPGGKAQGLSEWHVSILAAILFLENAAYSKTWAKSGNVENKDSQDRAHALLRVFLEWPRHGETTIAIALQKTDCQLLLNGMVVDHECLKESEAHLAKSRDSNKIGSLIGKDEHISEVFEQRRRRLRYRKSLGEAISRKLDFFLVEVAEAFADLWESTRGLSAWQEKDIVDLGVLTTQWGKCRPIPASYKASAISETRRSAGSAGRSVSGLIHCLSRASRMGRGLQLKKRASKSATARMAVMLEARSAKSQTGAAHPEAANFGQRAQSWDRLNYFRKSQMIAAKQHRFSLAMDATDVSYKKTMNATLCLPEPSLVMWMPPLDFGGPEGLSLPGIPGSPGLPCLLAQ
jgi:hypothetical protein